MSDELRELSRRIEDIVSTNFEKMVGFEKGVAEIKGALADFQGAVSKGGNDLAMAAAKLQAAVLNAERVAETVRSRPSPPPGKNFWLGLALCAVIALVLVAVGYFGGYQAGTRIKSGDIAARCAWTETPAGQLASSIAIELQQRGIEPNPQDSNFRAWVAWAFSPQGLTAFQHSQ
jgi:hypothetical protein